jgi:putative nucleotidyltransferase with HDIG domain
MQRFAILLVEDDETLRRLIARTLETKGYSVVQAEDGEKARDLLMSVAFDLVISDVKMTKLSGLELYKWNRENRPVPFIFMTGFSELLDVKSAFDLGALAFLTKPFDEQTLISEVEKAPSFPKTIASPPVTKEVPVEYCKILIDDFVSGSKIPFSIFISVSKTKFIKIAHSGQDISLKQVKSYKEKGVRFLYVTKDDYCKLVGFNLKITHAMSERPVDQGTKVKFLKYTGEVVAQQIFVSDLNKEVFETSKEFVELSLKLICDDEEAMLLLDVLNSHADFVYAHSVGVSTYAVMLAKQLGWLSPHTAFKVSLAGLYHDIGKKEIPRAMLEKSRVKMTPEERKLFETHPSRGREILESMRSFPSEIAEVAYQHHESNLGTGFPRAIRKVKIYPLASLISLANRFCELVLRTPSNEGMSAKAALEQLQTRHKEEFDASHLEALSKLVV